MSYTNHIYSRYSKRECLYYIRKWKLQPTFVLGIIKCGSEQVTRICGVTKSAFFVKYVLINDIYIQLKEMTIFG